MNLQENIQRIKVVMGLNEDNTTVTNKKLYSDSNITIETFDYDSNRKAIYLGGAPFALNLEVSNNNQKSKMLFTIVRTQSITIKNSFNGSMGLTSKEIKPNVSESFILFGDTSKNGLFVGTLTFAYAFAGSPVVTKTIDIPLIMNNKTPYDPYYICKTTYNKDRLNIAINWWKKWLNNQATKNRFAKTFNYDKDTVEKHFNEYNKILGQIKMEYTSTNRQLIAWVPKGSGKLDFNNWFRGGGYGLPIVINCKNGEDDSSEEVNSVLVHEIQHVLDDYHKFHPNSDNIFTYYANKFYSSSEDDAAKELKYVQISKILTQNGFTANIAEIGRLYEFLINKDLNHIKNSNELMSTLSEVRLELKLRPEQKITKELLVANQDKYVVVVFIAQWLYSKKTLSDFLNYNNSLAMGKTKTTDINLAQ